MHSCVSQRNRSRFQKVHSSGLCCVSKNNGCSRNVNTCKYWTKKAMNPSPYSEIPRSGRLNLAVEIAFFLVMLSLCAAALLLTVISPTELEQMLPILNGFVLRYGEPLRWACIAGVLLPLPSLWEISDEANGNPHVAILRFFGIFCTLQAIIALVTVL